MPDEAGPLTDTFQLSPQQECLWLHSPSRAATAIVCAGTIAGDAGSVRERLEALAATHEILRTTYPQQLGVRVPLQRVHVDLPVEWLELAGGASLAALAEAVSEPFDLEHGPVIRAAVASSERGLLAALATPAAPTSKSRAPASSPSGGRHTGRRPARNARRAGALVPRRVLADGVTLHL